MHSCWSMVFLCSCFYFYFNCSLLKNYFGKRIEKKEIKRKKGRSPWKPGRGPASPAPRLSPLPHREHSPHHVPALPTARVPPLSLLSAADSRAPSFPSLTPGPRMSASHLPLPRVRAGPDSMPNPIRGNPRFLVNCTSRGPMKL